MNLFPKSDHCCNYEINEQSKIYGKHFVNPFENNIFASEKDEGSRRYRFLFCSIETNMIEKSVLIQLAEEHLKDSPNYLVDVLIGSGNNIIIEIDNDKGVDIENCVALSRYIESNLDRDLEDFELTVTSAGLTSPLKTARQYKKFEGKDIEVLSKNGIKYKGVLKTSNENGFTITITKKVKPEGAKRKVDQDEEINFEYEEIKYTKYLIRF
ncbi:MAG TPA: ribosome assembly cofactor RimP [Fermentimonas sp.]|nr:ribosome assembly cofactor RimP [Fermentimonas sp.]